MQKLFSFLICFIFISNVYSQSEQDTKDFIIEKIESSPPANNYKNVVFFKNIIKIDAEHIAKREMSDVDFDNLFISAIQVLEDDRGVAMEIATCIDLRNVTKISTNRELGKNNHYSISLYLNDKGGTQMTKMTLGSKSSTEWTSISYPLTIIITDDKVIADKIKAAFMHLFKIKGIEVKDGDLF